MKRIIAWMMICVLVLSMLSSCGVPQTENLMENVTPSGRTVDDIALEGVSNAAITDFAVRLFREGAEEGKNTLISPLSVLVALSMTANGADSETLTQMKTVLGMPISQLNTWASRYMQNLPRGERYKLNLANSIWFTDDERFSVNHDFLQINADYYGADVYRAPFDGATCREINAWVKEKTDGMIRDILNEIPSDAVMYLINALAFDAEWQEIYQTSQIRPGKFTTEEGAVRDVELMYAEEGRYLEDENATGFIKYYRERKYAFAALLPREGMTLADYIATLDGEHLNELLSGAKTATVRTAIPKFETEYAVDMRELLIGMGMTDAFNPLAANFSKLGHSSAGNLFISRVLHKTFISVDGKGTRAGAATVVEVDDKAVDFIEDPKQVILDRPFVYMLIDCETNIPFFIGTMADTAQ
ncbi:MAG: serpin family protein [Clostridia bacterium]|nr:serpin family protein [Clostridia bacterium]